MCYTPENIPGDCRSIYNCPNVLAQFQGPLSNQATNYLRSLQCSNGNGQYPYVCCAGFGQFEQQRPAQSPNRNRQPWVTRLDRVEDKRKNNRGGGGGGSGNIIPGAGSCGLTSLAHRIYGGDETLLDDYPWMVILEYQNREYFFFSVALSSLSRVPISCPF